jgi:hypothetical protein
MGHGAWGMGHGALGMGHGAWGMGHWALAKQEEYLTFLRTAILYALRQELTIEYQHRQLGNSRQGTVPFPYPKIIDRPIGCDDRQPGY